VQTGAMRTMGTSPGGRESIMTEDQARELAVSIREAELAFEGLTGACRRWDVRECGFASGQSAGESWHEYLIQHLMKLPPPA
jgi:hypothetical protein